jgi:hypothetical protein
METKPLRPPAITISGITKIDFVYVVGDVFQFDLLVPPMTLARVLIARTLGCSEKVWIDGIEHSGVLDGAYLVFEDVPPGTHRFSRGAPPRT